MSKIVSGLLIGGGLAAIGAALLYRHKSEQITEAVKQALEPSMPPLPPGAPGTTIKVHTTGYWPFQAGLTAAQKKMEGAPVDRKGQPLNTLEDFKAGRAPFVSVAGDYEIWPYGQRIGISAWPGVVFRVVDTGGHFHGANKVFRVVGEEPLDICVSSSDTPVPKHDVTATIFQGDNFEKGNAVAVSKFKDQGAT